MPVSALSEVDPLLTVPSKQCAGNVTGAGNTHGAPASPAAPDGLEPELPPRPAEPELAPMPAPPD
jgi:hypothetical protein